MNEFQFPRLRLVRTDRNGCEKSLGHVGYDDSDKEDDGVEPEIVENEGDYEEGDTEEDGDGGDDVDKVCDLASYRCFDRLQPASQDRNPTHHCSISRVDHHTSARTYTRRPIVVIRSTFQLNTSVVSSAHKIPLQVLSQVLASLTPAHPLLRDSIGSPSTLVSSSK